MESGKLKENVIKTKSFDFAVSIIKLYKFLSEKKKEFVLSKQILRSGTSIGANVNEAQQGQSKKDFLMKMNISLKECSETKYWIELLYVTEYINTEQKDNILNKCIELEKMLTAIVKTTSESLK
ncbi:four helix bundle protein [bacterium]|nr:four helix bundle protein [bacterium]